MVSEWVDPNSWTVIFSLSISAWVIWFSTRVIRKQHRDWVSSGPHDPEVVAAIMARVGWWERKRLAREVGTK